MGTLFANFETVLGSVVDLEHMTIKGVSIATEGVAKGHNVLLDRKTLEQMKVLAEEFEGGLKVKIDHFSGFSGIVGSLVNFRIKGKKLLADLHLLKAHEAAPLILEMASRIPDSFGLSAAFSGPREEIEGLEFARVQEMYSADLVDQPAANPDGLFSKKVETSSILHQAEQSQSQMSTQTNSQNSTSSEISELTKSVSSLAAIVTTIQANQPKPEITDETNLSEVTLGDIKGIISAETAKQVTALGYKPAGAAAPSPTDGEGESKPDGEEEAKTFPEIISKLREAGMKKGEAVQFAIKQPENHEAFATWKAKGGSAHFA